MTSQPLQARDKSSTELQFESALDGDDGDSLHAAGARN